MTNIERAEKYARENKRVIQCSCHNYDSEKDLEEAYLAGIKAASKEKWHDLRKNPKDLPDACLNIVNQDGDKVRYDYVYEVWRTDDANDYICDDPIVWCEIPTFEEYNG